MDQITSAALGEYDVIVVVLGAVVAYLFKILERSVKSRLCALEEAVKESLKQHADCERRYVDSLKINAALEGRIAVLEQTKGASR